MRKKFWTDIEIEILRRHYPDMITKAIADALGRSERQVYQKARSLGLKKSDEYLASPEACRLRREDNPGVATRFEKGQRPWNKGKPFKAGGRSAETQFKKGEMAGAAQHNYVPIGSVRVTKYGALEQKVTDDPTLYPARRWRPVSHLVWERERGPIPDGHIVRFRPGMHTVAYDEITIGRLECITKAENMRRNTLHRYPKEVTDVIRARAVLNRRINHVEKHQ